MNPKAICADMAFHLPHDMQAFYRMHNIQRFLLDPHTPWPNRAEMGVRLFKKFLSALLDRASKNLDQTTLAQITPAQLMRKAATVRNPAFMKPEQQTSTSTKQNLLNEEIQKFLLATKTHFEIQQREDIRRDLAERMKFVPPDLRVGECVLLARRSKQDSARTEIWKMVEGGKIRCHRPHGGYQNWCVHLSGKCKQTRKTFGYCGSGRTSGFA